VALFNFQTQIHKPFYFQLHLSLQISKSENMSGQKKFLPQNLIQLPETSKSYADFKSVVKAVKKFNSKTF